jgi:hypothetical protein
MPPTPAYPLPDSTSGVGLRAQISREVLTAGGKTQKSSLAQASAYASNMAFFAPCCARIRDQGP